MCTASQWPPSAGPERWTADGGRPSSPGARPAGERVAASGASAEAGTWHGSLLAPRFGILTSQAPAAVAASDARGVAPAPVTSRAVAVAGSDARGAAAPGAGVGGDWSWPASPGTSLRAPSTPVVFAPAARAAAPPLPALRSPSASPRDPLCRSLRASTALGRAPAPLLGRLPRPLTGLPSPSSRRRQRAAVL